MKSAILSLFDNRLVTTSNLVSLKKVSNSVTLTLKNTFYVSYGSDEEATQGILNLTLTELSNFDMFQLEDDLYINLEAVTGANYAKPSATYSKYTVYVLLGKEKIAICKDTEEDAVALIESINTGINEMTADVVEKVEEEEVGLVDNTDASHPIIKRDITKANIADLLNADGKILTDITFDKQAGQLYKMTLHYFDPESKLSSMRVINITSATLMSTFNDVDDIDITLDTKE